MFPLLLDSENLLIKKKYDFFFSYPLLIQGLYKLCMERSYPYIRLSLTYRKRGKIRGRNRTKQHFFFFNYCSVWMIRVSEQGRSTHRKRERLLTWYGLYIQMVQTRYKEYLCCRMYCSGQDDSQVLEPASRQQWASAGASTVLPLLDLQQPLHHCTAQERWTMKQMRRLCKGKVTVFCISVGKLRNGGLAVSHQQCVVKPCHNSSPALVCLSRTHSPQFFLHSIC